MPNRRGFWFALRTRQERIPRPYAILALHACMFGAHDAVFANERRVRTRRPLVRDEVWAPCRRSNAARPRPRFGRTTRAPANRAHAKSRAIHAEGALSWACRSIGRRRRTSRGFVLTKPSKLSPFPHIATIPMSAHGKWAASVRTLQVLHCACGTLHWFGRGAIVHPGRTTGPTCTT